MKQRRNRMHTQTKGNQHECWRKRKDSRPCKTACTVEHTEIAEPSAPLSASLQLACLVQDKSCNVSVMRPISTSQYPFSIYRYCFIYKNRQCNTNLHWTPFYIVTLNSIWINRAVKNRFSDNENPDLSSFPTNSLHSSKRPPRCAPEANDSHLAPTNRERSKGFRISKSLQNS